jgi:catechol 2,3-dioxygenase-like lactoylglutathione lyase family enzyme
MSAALSPDELGDTFERFDHLALAVHDIRATLPLVELIGGLYRTGGLHPTAGFRWVQFTLPGDTKLELLSPADPADTDHFLNRFLTERGEGPHHVTFKVRDLRIAVAAARRAGYEVVGESYTGGWQEAFVHPSSAHGLLIQLAQWDDARTPAPRALDEVLDEPA